MGQFEKTEKLALSVRRYQLAKQRSRGGLNLTGLIKPNGEQIRLPRVSESNQIRNVAKQTHMGNNEIENSETTIAQLEGVQFT